MNYTKQIGIQSVAFLFLCGSASLLFCAISMFFFFFASNFFFISAVAMSWCGVVWCGVRCSEDRRKEHDRTEEKETRGRKKVRKKMSMTNIKNDSYKITA